MAKKFTVLEDRVISRPGAEERMATLRRETLAEYGLYQLRVDAGVSQVKLARRLGVTQPAVSKLENADDMRISTLRAYVEGLGAELAIEAVLANGTRLTILRSANQ